MDRGQRRAAFGCGSKSPRDEVCAHEGPRRVVNDDQVGSIRRGPKRVRDRVPSPSAPTDDTKRFAGGAQIRRWIVDELPRRGDDHFLDRRMIQERCDAPLEDRPSSDLEQLFEAGAAEPLAASAGRDDRCDMHAWNEG